MKPLIRTPRGKRYKPIICPRRANCIQNGGSGGTLRKRVAGTRFSEKVTELLKAPFMASANRRRGGLPSPSRKQPGMPGRKNSSLRCAGGATRLMNLCALARFVITGGKLEIQLKTAGIADKIRVLADGQN